ncbi:MAG: site-specific integrase [Opitutus sp.]|nr:site-specific integrase [Opitutus sp.]MCS6274405.1 site-specific integrase [Opitutus sp.]MCS6278389.1 site-specific integrase [Opitutus sp.]MCS6299499.1 site-specific integrase [Opitutus sp.]
MSQAPQFVISEFTNPSGEIVFRLTGWLDGKRIRKNFSTRAEAAAERQSMEIQQCQAETGIRATATRLSEEQLHEAEAAFQRLADAPKSLSFYLEFALATYRAPDREHPLAEAVATYIVSKEREHSHNLLSISQLDHIRRQLKVLIAAFPRCLVSQLTTRQLAEHCQRGNAKPKSFNNRRGILHTFFKFSFQHDWVAANPIEKIPHHRIAHRRGSAKTLSAAQAAKLMHHVERVDGGSLVPFFALALFAGIRPCVRHGEILKLQADYVRLDTGVILIEPEVFKVRMKRNVTIQPNLAAWLTAYPLDRFPIIPKNLQHTRAAVAKAFDLSHDIMRHTFISMHVAKYRSMGEAALQAGNSESIIRKHYLDLKTPAEAELFFGILPTACTSAAPLLPISLPSDFLPIAA